MAVVVSIDLTQFKTLTANLAKLGSSVGIELENALNDEAQVISTVAKELVPVDLGNLRASIKVFPPMRAFHVGQELFVQVVAGDTAIQYAEIQEENEGFQHTVGQAHYMKEATKVAIEGIEERLTERLEGVR